jgi:uncharacterized protein GlcG (DUF336 family)
MNMKSWRTRTCLATLLVMALVPLGAGAATPAAPTAPATFQLKQLTPEAALVAAQAALTACRKAGYQVAVAVVDRAGVTQVLLRDRLAGPHTVEVAPRKAWTAASLKIPTTAFANETQAGKPLSGLRALPQFMAVGGGLPIEGGGNLFGGIGVSGAPGGDADEACAAAGVRAISDELEF